MLEELAPAVRLLAPRSAKGLEFDHVVVAEPAAIVEERGLGAAGSDELGEIVERAMADQADAVEKIKAGNEKAIGAIVGAVMRETKGRADGGEVQRMIRDRIGT